MRDLLRGIHTETNYHEQTDQIMHAVPTIDHTRNQTESDLSPRWENILRGYQRAFNAGQLSSGEYSEIVALYTRRRALGFQDYNLPSIFESQEIWDSNKNVSEENWIERISVNNLSITARQRFDEWANKNKNIIPKWTIKQVLSLKEYPRSDGVGGTIKILYFNTGDNQGEFIDLTY